jgi:exopolysaccharide biosynthesis protein
MKNFILSASLLATTMLFANTKEKIDQTAISKKQKVEISKTTDKTVYFWEVNTPTGYASGYTLSEAKALKTIKLMATNDIVTYRIVEAYK